MYAIDRLCSTARRRTRVDAACRGRAADGVVDDGGKTSTAGFEDTEEISGVRRGIGRRDSADGVVPAINHTGVADIDPVKIRILSAGGVIDAPRASGGPDDVARRSTDIGHRNAGQGNPRECSTACICPVDVLDGIALDLVGRTCGGGNRNGGESVVLVGLGPGGTGTKRRIASDVVP